MNEELIQDKDAIEVVSDCYVSIAKYVARTRAYPSSIDGMKAVQRRLVYSARNYNKLVKASAIVGDTMKIHPHGDASISTVLVNCTCQYNRFPLFNGKGNFGGLGFSASAVRYLEACLNDIARLLYLELVDYADYEEGESGNQEPKYLPALIPYCFLVGSQGMTVGLPTANIPPLNVMELVDYYINLLSGDKVEYPSPDFGGVLLNCDRTYSDELLKTGYGKLWFSPIIYREGNKLVITEETPNSTIDKVLKKLKWYIDNEIIDYIDETDQHGYRHVFVINNEKSITLSEVENIIRKALNCSMTYRIIVEENSTVYYCTFDFIVNHQLKYLRECVCRKFNDVYGKNYEKLQILDIIDKMRNDSEIMEILHKVSSDELINILVSKYNCSVQIASDVIKRPISYLTKSHDNEKSALEQSIKDAKEYKSNPNKYLLELYYRLKDLIKPFYNSRTHSIYINDVNKINSNRCKLSKDHLSIIFDNSYNINWNSGLLVVDKLGIINYIQMSKLNKSPKYLEDYAVDICGDIGKYVVIITSNAYISVIDINKFKFGINNVIKSWGEEYPVTKIINTNNEHITVVDNYYTKIELKCSDFIKSRITYPTRVISKKRSIIEVLTDEQN